jgi:hypothetical protein
MGMEVKNFTSPDETRPFEGKGKADVVMMAGRPVAKAVFEPGWRWSTNIRPIAGTDLCEVSHLGYCVSGRMRVMMAGGGEHEVGPGDVFAIPGGHDAEVLGSEECVVLDFGDIEKYAAR